MQSLPLDVAHHMATYLPIVDIRALAIAWKRFNQEIRPKWKLIDKKRFMQSLHTLIELMNHNTPSYESQFWCLDSVLRHGTQEMMEYIIGNYPTSEEHLEMALEAGNIGAMTTMMPNIIRAQHGPDITLDICEMVAKSKHMDLLHMILSDAMIGPQGIARYQRDRTLRYSAIYIAEYGTGEMLSFVLSHDPGTSRYRIGELLIIALRAGNTETFEILRGITLGDDDRKHVDDQARGTLIYHVHHLTRDMVQYLLPIIVGTCALHHPDYESMISCAAYHGTVDTLDMLEEMFPDVFDDLNINRIGIVFGSFDIALWFDARYTLRATRHTRQAMAAAIESNDIDLVDFLLSRGGDPGPWLRGPKRDLSNPDIVPMLRYLDSLGYRLKNVHEIRNAHPRVMMYIMGTYATEMEERYGHDAWS